MKTPMQELIDIIKQRINDDDSIPYMYNERILELAESLLEKEKRPRRLGEYVNLD